MAGVGNVFSDIPDELPDELSEVLVRSGCVRVERIVSRGHRSPVGFWYAQDEDEFVLLIEGEAELEIEGEAGPRALSRGDWLSLPAGLGHRVSWTTPERDTIWLAIFAPPSLDRTGGREGAPTR